MVQAELYQSVLHKLSLIPIDYLQQVDNYLTDIQEGIKNKEKNRNAILQLAGAWSDMSETDFEDYLNIAKDSGNELFNREVEL